ncbi:MAG TPA: SBBP repeat-containing protein, partial [Bacteroidia bacterium]|nr:SBBP repeat-containing protein [Bacteroidia bacterium]
MRKIFCIIVILIALFSNAQVPNWQWAKSHGSTASENISGLAVNSIGESYTCGYYFSSNFTIGTYTLTNNGNYDSYVAKFDVNGNPLWVKSFGGGFDDNANAIAIDAIGNSYVVGSFISASMVCGTTTLTNSAFGDMFIVKMDVNGNILWAKNFGDGGSTVANAVAVEASGNVLISGYYNSATLTMGTFTLNTFGNNDAFVAKLDASGNVMWAQSFGDNLAENANGITVDPSGNSYVTGLYKSSSLTVGTTTLNNTSPASADIFLIKLNNMGNVLTATTFGDMLDEVATGITRDINGNIILTGYYFSPSLTIGTSTLSNYGSRDMLVIKT